MPEQDELGVHELITTTRSVRRRLDLARPVELDVVLDCLDDARQAPNGGNDEYWRFVVVTDAARRRRIGELYRAANADFAAGLRAAAAAGDEVAARQVTSSAVLWEHLGEVPVLVVLAFEAPDWFDPSSPYALASCYGSVFPAAWNFQLACRLRGLGSCLVTSHLPFAAEIGELLELPGDFHQVAMVAVAPLRGTRFAPAARRPSWEVVRINSWRGDSTARP